MRTITTERVPIIVWGEALDEQTVAQARNLANLPFAFHHIALLPDAHVGYGMPIGGVLATEGEVIPHAVGLDIGCGVRAWRTGIPAAEVRPSLPEMIRSVERSIPTGFDWHKTSQANRTDLFDDVPDSRPLAAEIEKAQKQAGTLGGGNHFIEFQEDDEGCVWVMLHSGSRNVGKQMADHYDQVARNENRGRSAVPEQWGLAHLPIDSEAGSEYLAVMDFCLRFARENRRLMMDSVRAAIARRFPGVETAPVIDVHHNYAAIETHMGREVVVHRKGAVLAEGRVVVPGTMGTSSYVCEGLANPRSFRSCSHGAGRAMSRKQAKKTISVDAVLRDMERRGITLRSRKRSDVAEEAAEAYKDIDIVMAEQADLVKPVVQLTPMGVLKG